LSQDKLTDEQFYNSFKISKAEFDSAIRDFASMGALQISEILDKCVKEELRKGKWSVLVELFPKIMERIAEKYCEQVMYFIKEGSDYASTNVAKEHQEEIKHGL
jgi:hypothetical protein